MIKEFVY